MPPSGLDPYEAAGPVFAVVHRKEVIAPFTSRAAAMLWADDACLAGQWSVAPMRRPDVPDRPPAGGVTASTTGGKAP